MTVGELRSLLADVHDDAIVCVPDFSTGDRDGEYQATSVTYKDGNSAWWWTGDRVVIE